ncbi:probable glutathione S-transferase [Salvia splendens]|nr:probable glutathione S-transferase [Salvia splendens]
MSKVKVLGFWYSPFVARVKMALKMKGVEFEYVEENIRAKSELLLESNPIHKKVPVLIHDGKAIVETMIILEYIDQTWEGPPILPRDPYHRAMARFWVNFIDEKCLNTMLKACWRTGEEQEKWKEEAILNFQILENEIKGKKYFGGDEISVVDHAANFIAYWFPLISWGRMELVTEDQFPNLWRWSSHYCNHPFVKDNLPPMDVMIPKFKPA